MTTAFIYKKSKKISLKFGVSCSILCHFLLVVVLICVSLHRPPNFALTGGGVATKAIFMSPLILVDLSHSSTRSMEKNTDKKLIKKMEKSEVARLISEQKQKQSNKYEKYGMKHVTEHRDNNIKQDVTTSRSGGQATVYSSLKSRHHANRNRPLPIYRRSPDYPRQALAMRVEGKVVVQYDVDNNGRVTNIRIVSAKPNTIFNRSIKNAMHFWQYEAKTVKDLTITILFNRDKSVKFHSS